MGYSPWGHQELDTTERLHFTSRNWIPHAALSTEDPRAATKTRCSQINECMNIKKDFVQLWLHKCKRLVETDIFFENMYTHQGFTQGEVETIERLITMEATKTSERELAPVLSLGA